MPLGLTMSSRRRTDGRDPRALQMHDHGLAQHVIVGAGGDAAQIGQFGMLRTSDLDSAGALPPAGLPEASKPAAEKPLALSQPTSRPLPQPISAGIAAADEKPLDDFL